MKKLLKLKNLSMHIRFKKDSTKGMPVQNPYVAKQVDWAQEDAWKKLKEHYKFYAENGENGAGDGKNKNAFLHSYWNALLAKRIGLNKARLFTSAHEYGAPGNIYANSKMDLFNNNVGLYTGIKMKDKSDDQIAKYLIERIEKGGLLRTKVNGKYLNKTVLTNADLN